MDLFMPSLSSAKIVKFNSNETAPPVGYVPSLTVGSK